MFHWFDTVTNTRGDALPNWQVECVEYEDGATVVPIFADENSTPIVSVSGVANRAVADSDGNYDFFVPSGTYSLRFYNAQGVFQRTLRYITMFGADVVVGAPGRTISGTTGALTTADRNGVIKFTSNSAVTFTVEGDSIAALNVNDFTEFHQLGTGSVTFVAGSGVTLLKRGTNDATAGQNAVAAIRKLSANTYNLTGDLI